MVATAIMAFIVVREVWNWTLAATIALIVPIVLVDGTFLAANLFKIVDGGWVPLTLGGVVMVIMYTWRRGSKLLFDKTLRQEMSLHDLVATLAKQPPQRATATARFL